MSNEQCEIFDTMNFQDFNLEPFKKRNLLKFSKHPGAKSEAPMTTCKATQSMLYNCNCIESEPIQS